MSIDQALIGQTVAKLMDDIEDDHDGATIIAVGIVVAIDHENATYTRIRCSDEVFYKQLGLFHSAVRAVEGGWERITPGDEDDDND